MTSQFPRFFAKPKLLAVLTLTLLLAACGGGGGGSSGGGTPPSGGGGTPVSAAPTLSLFAGTIGQTAATANSSQQNVIANNYTTTLCAPSGLAVTPSGNLIVIDPQRQVVYNVTPSGGVQTLAGDDYIGVNNGTGTQASFAFASVSGLYANSCATSMSPIQLNGVAVDSQGNSYVADSGNFLIRKITPGGVVSTFAGGGMGAGYVDGPAASARFYFPTAIAIDAQDNLFVTDLGNNRIRKITPDGTVSTFAGSGTSANVDGTGTAASFMNLDGIAIDSTGNLYVTQYVGNIRKITPAGVVTTLAGTAGVTGGADGTGPAAQFNAPQGIAVDPAGNVFVADTGDCTIRKITQAGVVTTIAGTQEQFYFTPGALPGGVGMPIGLAWHNNTLYVSTLEAIIAINNLP